MLNKDGDTLSTYGRRSRLSDPNPCVLESPKHTTTGASGPAATFAFFAAGGIVDDRDGKVARRSHGLCPNHNEGYGKLSLFRST